MKSLVTLAALLALNGLAFSQWSDDFNRADGPIGGNWNQVSGNWSIVSNQGSLASGLNVRMFHTIASAPYDTSVAKLDVFVNGTGLQYTGLIIGANGTDSILVKLQEQSSTGNFSNIGIYHQTSATGWGGFSGAGTSFAALSSPFPSARLTVYFSDPDTLVAEIDTNFDGVADQSYTHAGVSAIAPNFGTGFGIGGYGSNTLFDNFNINGGGPPPIVTYCTAGTSTNGCLPAISASAQPSVNQANACLLSVANVEGQKSGLIFYGLDNTGFVPLAWGVGSSSFLCVKPPTQRMVTQSSGGTVGQCDGALSQDFNAFLSAFPAALGQPFAAGGKVFAQAWYRDPQAVKTTNLSNALELTFVP